MESRRRNGFSLTGVVALVILLMVVGLALLYAYRAYVTPLQ